jgi:predicted ATPase with chaperone activity
MQAARERQPVCFEGMDIVRNFDMRLTNLRHFCRLDDVGEKSGADSSNIVLCMSQSNLSAQGHHRVLKLARTITDLTGSD